MATDNFLIKNLRDFSTETILIIDDEEAYRKLLSTLLQKVLNAKTVTCKNPKEAFDYLETNTPSLILLDMQMPIMDGQTTLKYIRASDVTRDIPVIICTALSSERLLLNLAKLKISDYILKPSDPKIIIDKIVKVLSKKI